MGDGSRPGDGPPAARAPESGGGGAPAGPPGGLVAPPPSPLVLVDIPYGNHKASRKGRGADEAGSREKHNDRRWEAVGRAKHVERQEVRNAGTGYHPHRTTGRRLRA